MGLDDIVVAITVTINCAKKVGRNEPMEPEDDLFSHGIDNELTDRLVNAIATDKSVGLPSLKPKFKIDQNVFDIDEDSTINDVATIVFNNAVQDTSASKKRSTKKTLASTGKKPKR